MREDTISNLLGSDIVEGQANRDLFEHVRRELLDVFELVDVRLIMLGTVLLRINDSYNLLNVKAPDEIFSDDIWSANYDIIDMLAC